LLTYSYAGDKALPDFIYLMDADGKIIHKQALKNLDLKLSFVDQENQKPRIFTYDANGKIIKFGCDLEIIQKVDLPKRNMAILGLDDLNGDRKNEFICLSSDELFILNKKLKKIARFPQNFENFNFCFFSKRHTGPMAPIEFVVHNSNYSYLFSLRKNNMNALLPFIFIGINGLLFFLLLLFHRIMTILNIYITFFLFSLRKSNQGIMLLDHKGKIFYFNARMQRLVHPSVPILRKLHFTELFNKRPSVLECFQKAFELQKSYECSLNIHDSNRQFQGEMVLTPFVSPFGFVYAYLVEVSDHTQPILNDRLKVWSRSVQKMAHDIKQPLSSISLHLKALQMRLEDIGISDYEGIRDDIHVMQTEMEKVRQITNNFLKFVNLETPKFQWIDLHETIQQGLNRFKPLLNGNLQCDFEFDPDISSIWADPRQLEIVLHIIIENAIDAMKGKGQIRISTNLIEDLENFDKQFIQIEIADSGPGIEKSIKDNIFEPFFTTKMDGTGMGLAIAKKIIAQI